MEGKYREYIEERNMHFPTSIHTRINNKYRISTIYRRASTIEPIFFWETFVWECSDGRDQVYQSESHYGIEEVLKYHYDKYFELGGF